MHSDILAAPQLALEPTDKRPAVLIIDDDESMADVLALRLKRQGFETISADSGRAGLALAQSEHPALVLLDLRLPDVDGFTVCERLVDSPDTCTIPVIILSGMEGPDIVRRCRAAGSQYFVRKPYDPNALLVLIQHALGEMIL